MKYFTNRHFWFISIFIVIERVYPTISEDSKIINAGAIVLRSTLNGISKFAPPLDAALAIWDGYKELVDLVHDDDTKADGNQQIASIANKIDRLFKDAKFYYNDISQSIDVMTQDLKLNDELSLLRENLLDIETSFSPLAKEFNSGNFTLETGKNIDTKDLTTYLDKLVLRFTFPGSNIFPLMLNSKLKNNLVCSKKSSIQQQVYRLYQLVYNAQVKGLLALIFAHSAYKNEKGMQKALTAHFEHTEELVEVFSVYLNKATRDVWTCDPKHAIEGVTYERFGRAFQKYLFNPKNAEPPRSPGDSDPNYCPATCENVPEDLYEASKIKNPLIVYRFFTKHRQIANWFANDYFADPSRRQDEYVTIAATYSTDKEKGSMFMHKDVDSNRCYNGYLRNCKTLAQNELKVCKAENSSQVERYAYIRLSSSEIYGSESACKTKPEDISIRTGSFWEKVFSPFLGTAGEYSSPCLYCMCTCVYGDEIGTNSSDRSEFGRLDIDRYIDLRPVQALEGFIVTGIAMKKDKKAHTFHLYIQQAKLLPKGRVSRTSGTGHTVYPRQMEYQSDKTFRPLYKENVDYHKIMYENTTFSLGNVTAPRDDELVTGVKFQAKLDEDDGKVNIGLSVRFTRFDFATGNLTNRHEWREQDFVSKKYRTKVTVDDGGLPFKYANKKVKYSGYVQLANTGENVDVGQNILPFIDIKNVETKPLLPLSGVGLYHRGTHNSGGYLGLKVHNLNLGLYLPNIKDLHSKKRLINDINIH